MAATHLSREVLAPCPGGLAAVRWWRAAPEATLTPMRGAPRSFPCRLPCGPAGDAGVGRILPGGGVLRAPYATVLGEPRHSVAEALATLQNDDPSAAADVEAALDWLLGEEGPDRLTRDLLPDYLWYRLPLRVAEDPDHSLYIAAALAHVLDDLGLSLYAAICRSPVTQRVLRAYAAGEGAGLAAYRRASAGSGTSPPDLPELGWRSTMGWVEARAHSSCADALERAVAAGDLVPGRHGWRGRQQELVRAHLTSPRLDLDGRTLAEVIRTERFETWLGGPRSEARRRILAPVVDRIRRRPEMRPAGLGDAPAPLRWLLEQLAGGLALTQTGNLNRAFVRSVAPRFGWHFDTAPRGEHDVGDLSELRLLAQRLRLARRSGGRLRLTPKGRTMLADPPALARAVAAALVDEDPFTAATGELALALLLPVDSLAPSEIASAIAPAIAEAGFWDRRTDAPPDAQTISWVMHATLNRCRALGLLSTGGDWRDRRYGLTDAGKAIALEALRGRAVGPGSGFGC